MSEAPLWKTSKGGLHCCHVGVAVFINEERIIEGVMHGLGVHACNAGLVISGVTERVIR